MKWVSAGALFAMLLVASGAMAQAPTISGGNGTFATGNTFSITGSGFGTKASPNPYKYDDFEGGNVGGQLSGWQFDTGGGTTNPLYSNRWLRANSTRSAECPYVDGQYLSTFGVYRPEGLETVYMDFWVLFDRPATVSRNHKLYRLYPGVNGGLPNQYLVSACPAIGPEAWFTNDGVSGGWNDTHAYPGWNQYDADDNWVHMQVFLKQSDAGVANGTLQAWFDGHLAVNRTDYQSRDTTNSASWHSLWFGNYLGHGTDGTCLETSGDNYILFDNVYIDVTRARVEAGNSADYNACTHREIQVPLSWDTGSIDFTVNAGSFGNGESVWLFVVDSNGNVSAGKGPYTVSGTAVEVPGQPGKPYPDTQS